MAHETMQGYRTSLFDKFVFVVFFSVQLTFHNYLFNNNY